MSSLALFSLYVFHIYIFIFINFILFVFLLVVLVTLAGVRFRKKLPLDREKISPFECGFTPKFNARLPFTLRFFLIALIFLVFDVELVLLFPFLVSLFSIRRINIITIVIFLLVVLSLGLLHEWNQGSLEWAS